ncbi:MAG TPA: class I SAM-dependent methyltransferase [Micromonosporaceae bacterium]|nr:class I SAM-dependent methyltransferase [Micromonosporaceae bacterium]
MSSSDPGIESDRRFESRRRSFNAHADDYHDGRPGYPARVFDLLSERCGLAPGSRALEIGAGPGLATTELIARGAHVVAVEPGEALATLLRARCPNAVVVPGEIETAAIPGAPFDLAVAATAWHWVDSNRALPRVAGLVRPGGWFAVWWTEYGDPAQRTAFRVALDDVYRRYLPHEMRDPTDLPASMRAAEWTERLRRGGYFDRVETEMIRWSYRLTRDRARRLWATFPNVNELLPADRAGFLDSVGDVVDRFGGAVDDPYVTAIYLARRQTQAPGAE